MTLQRRTLVGIEILEAPGDPDGPTIILMHGYGADNHDLASFSQLFELKPRPTWIFPNGPLTIHFSSYFSGRAWFPIDMEALNTAIQTNDLAGVISAFPIDLKKEREHLENLIAALNVPRSKLILGGFSQGAVLALDAAFHYHESCAALIILSGTLANTNWNHLAPLHAHTSFFQSHGTEDRILPFTLAEELEKLLHRSHLKGKLHSFKGGHEVPQPILQKLFHFLENNFEN